MPGFGWGGAVNHSNPQVRRPSLVAWFPSARVCGPSGCVRTLCRRSAARVSFPLHPPGSRPRLTPCRRCAADFAVISIFLSPGARAAILGLPHPSRVCWGGILPVRSKHDLRPCRSRTARRISDVGGRHCSVFADRTQCAGRGKQFLGVSGQSPDRGKMSCLPGKYDLYVLYYIYSICSMCSMKSCKVVRFSHLSPYLTIHYL